MMMSTQHLSLNQIREHISGGELPTVRPDPGEHVVMIGTAPMTVLGYIGGLALISTGCQTGLLFAEGLPPSQESGLQELRRPTLTAESVRDLLATHIPVVPNPVGMLSCLLGRFLKCPAEGLSDRVAALHWEDKDAEIADAWTQVQKDPLAQMFVAELKCLGSRKRKKPDATPLSPEVYPVTPHPWPARARQVERHLTWLREAHPEETVGTLMYRLYSETLQSQDWLDPPARPYRAGDQLVSTHGLEMVVLWRVESLVLLQWRDRCDFEFTPGLPPHGLSAPDLSVDQLAPMTGVLVDQLLRARLLVGRWKQRGKRTSHEWLVALLGRELQCQPRAEAIATRLREMTPRAVDKAMERVNATPTVRDLVLETHLPLAPPSPIAFQTLAATAAVAEREPIELVVGVEEGLCHLHARHAKSTGKEREDIEKLMAEVEFLSNRARNLLFDAKPLLRRINAFLCG